MHLSPFLLITRRFFLMAGLCCFRVSSLDLFMDSTSSARLFCSQPEKLPMPHLLHCLIREFFTFRCSLFSGTFSACTALLLPQLSPLFFSLSAAIILTISWARKISPSFFPGFRAYLKIISAVCTPRLQELAEYSFIHAKKRGV